MNPDVFLNVISVYLSVQCILSMILNTLLNLIKLMQSKIKMAIILRTYLKIVTCELTSKIN